LSPPVLEKAVQLLALRPHFRRELAAKLAARGYPDEEVAAALDRLEADGYLDDRKHAEEFVALRLERRKEGAGRLRAELERRGVAPELAAETVRRQAPPEDELAAALAAAAGWQRGQRSGSGGDPRSLARHLARKGFSRHAIVTVLSRFGDGTGDGRATEDWDPEP
jgi:regulatory protein